MLTKEQILRTLLKSQAPRDEGPTLRDFLEQNRRDIEGLPSALRTWEPGAKTSPPPDADDHEGEP